MSQLLSTLRPALGSASTHAAADFDAAGLAASDAASAQSAAEAAAEAASDPVGSAKAIVAAMLGFGEVIDCSNLGLVTFGSSAIAQLVAWAQIADQNGNAPHIDLSNNELNFDVVRRILSAFSGAGYFSHPGTLHLEGGTNWSPAGTPALYTVDFSAVDVAAIIAGGVAVSGGSYVGLGLVNSISLDPTIPFSASSFTETDESSLLTIGVSDSPTTDQIAPFAATYLWSSQDPTVAGSVVSVVDNTYADALGSFTSANGVVLTQTQGCVAPADGFLELIGAGWTIYTN